MKDSSGIGIYYDTAGFWLGSGLRFPLGDLIYSEIWHPVGLQFIMDIPPRSKVRYSDLVGYPLRDILSVPHSGSCPKFPPHTYGTCLISPLQTTIYVALYGG